MRNTTDEFRLSPKEVKIEGIDQQKAQAAWTKLKGEKFVTQISLIHPRHTFEVFIDNVDYIEEPHYQIEVFAPGADVNEDDPFCDLLLVKEEKEFSVIDYIDSEAGQVSLTVSEVNSFLEKIANSTREADKKTGEAEEVIRQTRDRLG